jgi:hypothetical protein
MRPRAGALRAQARRHKAAGDLTGADWRKGRALSVMEQRSARVQSCQTTAMTVACKCGPKRVLVGCGQRWLCETCRVRAYRLVRRDSLRSWRVHERAREAQWHAANRPAGGRWGSYFVRLSVRHSGDVAADRATIERGWRRLRSWLCRRLGRDYPGYATDKGTCSFPYQLMWEATAGSDGLGHVHAHVIVMWPWLDWADLHTAWVRATNGDSNHIDVQKVRGGVRAVADYAAKYASKGVKVQTMSGDLAGRVLASFWSKRVVSACRRFWNRGPCRCPECRCTFDITERPESRRRKWDHRARYVALAQAPPIDWLRSCGMLDTYRSPGTPLRRE